MSCAMAGSYDSRNLTISTAGSMGGTSRLTTRSAATMWAATTTGPTAACGSGAEFYSLTAM